MRPADLPPAERFAGRPHGLRIRYISGCRCAECRRANAQYELSRAKARRNGEWNGLVPAGRARRRLLLLSKACVGRRSIHMFTGIAESILSEVRSGCKKQIRAKTHQLIMACDAGAIADGGRVSGADTARQLAWLIDEGFTKRDLARRLGSKAKVPSLQIKPGQVTRRTADRVLRIYRQYHEEAA